MDSACAVVLISKQPRRATLDTNHLTGRAIFQSERPLTTNRTFLVAILFSLAWAERAEWRPNADVLDERASAAERTNATRNHCDTEELGPGTTIGCALGGF